MSKRCSADEHVGALQIALTGAAHYVSECQLPDMRRPIGECRSPSRGRTGRSAGQLNLAQSALDRCALERQPAHALGPVGPC